MIIFVEKRTLPSSIQIGQKVSEATNYSNISIPDAVTKLVASNGKRFHCYLLYRENGHELMENEYSDLRVVNSELRFSKGLGNRLIIRMKEVVKANIGENIEGKYTTLHFILRNGLIIGVTPL
jgi:hypothetical protein